MYFSIRALRSGPFDLARTRNAGRQGPSRSISFRVSLLGTIIDRPCRPDLTGRGLTLIGQAEAPCPKRPRRITKSFSARKSFRRQPVNVLCLRQGERQGSAWRQARLAGMRRVSMWRRLPLWPLWLRLSEVAVVVAAAVVAAACHGDVAASAKGHTTFKSRH
jgi:hypothetical protein